MSGISTESLPDWYKSVAKDIKGGKPLVFTHFVPLCDNVHQGIAPVPKQLGDGDAPKTNLYWGAAFGYKTFFKNKSKWKLVNSVRPESGELAEVLVFKRIAQAKGQWAKAGIDKPFTSFLVIVGYSGRYIAKTNSDFLKALSGTGKSPLMKIEGLGDISKLQSQMVSYSGHNYLMDLGDQGKKLFAKNLSQPNSAMATMILACHSQSYFQPALESAGILPLVLTTNFMAPEAYTAAAVYESLLAGRNISQIHEAAAGAYAKYQKISIKSGRRMFYSKGK